jgi:hypothetical protein
MKVFISHQQADSTAAAAIKRQLELERVDAYLDLLDTAVASGGVTLTNHIKNRLNECTDILVVLSTATKESWWVPFEIGMASQKDFPIVNYLVEGIKLPEYLEYWPRLKSLGDLSTYVNTNASVRRQILLERATRGTMYASEQSETVRFYQALKQALR